MKAYEYLVQFTDRGTAKKLAYDEGLLDRKTREVGNEMDRTDRKAREMGRGFGMASSRGLGLTSMFGRMAASIAPLLTVTALLAGGGKLSKAAREYEQIGIAFETMLGSAEQSKETISQLNDFANFTPFSNDEVFRYSKSLLAYNIEAKDLLPTLGALGDIASGVGREKFPNLILAFGQVKAATKLTGMELRQFTETGVPMLELLSNVTGKSVSTIKEDLIPAGEIGFDLVQKALFSATQEGGKFFNLMEKQSASFGGRLSTLSGKIGLLSIAYGEKLNNNLTDTLEFAIGVTDRLIYSTKSSAEKFEEQSDKVAFLNTEMQPLIDKYNLLNNGEELSIEQQKELKTVTKSLADMLPSAVSKWNVFGEAIEFSNTALENHISLNKDALARKNEDVIDDTEERLKSLRAELALYNRQHKEYLGLGASDRKSFDELFDNDLITQINALAGSDGGLIQEAIDDLRRFKGLRGFSNNQYRLIQESGFSSFIEDESYDYFKKVIPGFEDVDPNDPNESPTGNEENGLGIQKGINGITAGGGKNVTINFGGVKFAESIQFSVKDSEEAKSKMEPQMREFFNRLLQGGLHTATGG